MTKQSDLTMKITDFKLHIPQLSDGYFIAKCVIKSSKGVAQVVSDGLIVDTSITYYENPALTPDWHYDEVHKPNFDECYHCGKTIDLTRYT